MIETGMEVEFSRTWEDVPKGTIGDATGVDAMGYTVPHIRVQLPAKRGQEARSVWVPESILDRA